MMVWQWHQLNHMQAVCTSLQKTTTTTPHQSDFYGPDAFSDNQSTASKHWRPSKKPSLPNFQMKPLGKLITCASDTRQYNLILVKGWWCCMAGKVIVSLALHWSCVTDRLVFIHLQTNVPRKGDEHPAYNSRGVWHTLPKYIPTPFTDKDHI